MTKTKGFWAALAAFSLAAAGFSGYAMYTRLTIQFADDTVEIRRQPAPKVPLPEEAAAEPEPAPRPAPEAAEPKEEPQKQKAVKMLFEYKNASARRVSVSGSFTRWKDIPMSKKGGAWKAEVYILPGNYLYHFTVDGKKTLDPGKARAPVGESIAIVNDEAAADARK